MKRSWWLWLLLWLGLVPAPIAAQPGNDDVTGKSGNVATDDAVANPGRPTVSTPAAITPVGYFQFETGVMGAWTSPEFSSQFNFNEVIKFSVSHWIELIAASAPYVHAVAGGQTFNGTGARAWERKRSCIMAKARTRR